MKGFVTRSIPSGKKALATLDEKSRSLEVVGTTSDKVKVFDWESWGTVDEVLLMSGLVMPASGQVPLLDSHDRYGVAQVLGSYRELRTEGQELLGRVYFSKVKEADDAFVKVAEGHLTDYSVGYTIDQYEKVSEGQTAVYDGLSIEGPCRVVTAWRLQELSVCPIGADPRAKGRGFYNQSEEDEMKKNKGRREDQKPEEQEDLPEEEETEEPEEGREGEGSEEEEREGENGEEEEREEEEPKEAAKSSAPVMSERKRITGINAMCREFGMPETLSKKLIDDGASLNSARAVVMERLKAARSQGPGFGVRVTADERDKFRAAAQDAIFMRCGQAPKKTAAGADELRGYTLRELARECLVRAGHRPPAGVMDMVGRALTTTDLPILLTEASRRFLLEGFGQAEETWAIWTGEGSVVDFRDHKLVDATVDNRLDEIGQDDEYTFGEMREGAETYSIVTYGKKFRISRQAIINDDLNVLSAVPQVMGQGASRTVGDKVYGVLLANSKMADGKALFHADHRNILPGKGGIPSVETLGAADTAMGLQKDAYGNRLNIKPQFFLAPLALRVPAEQFFNTQLIGDQARPNMVNPYAGAFTRVYEPRLDDDSKTNWYYCARPELGVRVFYLDGVKEPWLETREGWDTDGVEHKVRFDVGVKAVTWRGLLKAAA